MLATCPNIMFAVVTLRSLQLHLDKRTGPLWSASIGTYVALSISVWHIKETQIQTYMCSSMWTGPQISMTGVQ
jgi:hypothetical protein